MISGTVRNLVFLGTMQATNYLVPIIVIPILLERIGLEKYGIIVFAQGICSIAVAITDYGLNLTGTRDISQNESDIHAQQSINVNILMTRLVLVTTGFIVLFVLAQLFPRWRAESLVILTSYTIVIAQGLLPQWYFEGIQKMHFLSILTFLSRLTYLLAIIFFIQSPEDYSSVNLLNGLSWLVCSLIGLGLVFYRTGISKIRFSWSVVKQMLQSNIKISLSGIVAAGYRNGPILIAGSVFGPIVLGIYGVLDKLVSLISTSGAILFRSVFPTVSTKVQEQSINVVQAYITKFLLRILSITLPGSLIFAWLGPELLALASDKIVADEVQFYFYPIAALPILLYTNLKFSLPLLAYDLKSEYLKFNLAGLITLLIFGLMLSYWWGISGLLFALLATEVSMLLTGWALTKREFRST